MPHDTLVRQVHDRTGGNAYLNQLLVQDVPATATHLSDGALPDDLTSAVLRSWHQLSPGARKLSRVLAVSGSVARGTHVDDLARLAHVEEPGPLLRECVEAGVLDVQGGDGYWFHHPLQAEALEAGLSAPERRRLHAAFAATLDADLDAAAPDLATLLLVADHHYRAGDSEAAHNAAVRASEMAEGAGAWSEAVRLLRRTLEVSAPLDATQEDRPALWWRVRDAAALGGDLDAELEATDALIDEPELAPLATAELLVRRQHLRFLTGGGFLDVQELRRAVELSRAEPGSWQHAFALAELTHALLWQDDPEADPVGSAALQRARECGHPRALAYALAANAMRAVVEDRPAEGQVLAEEAGRAAAEARDGWAFVHATLWEANALDTPVSPAWRALVGRRRQELVTLGLPHPYEAWLACNEAFGQLHGGSWRACPALLRVALGATPGASVDVQARLGAAWLAAQQGRVHEAEGHLARADELFTETSTFLAFEFDAVRATVHLAAGRPAWPSTQRSRARRHPVRGRPCASGCCHSPDGPSPTSRRSSGMPVAHPETCSPSWRPSSCGSRTCWRTWPR